jgi:hypothetical protein
VLTPVVGGADNDPLGKRLLAGSGKETVYVILLELIVLRVKLALDRMDFTRSLCSGD